MMDGNDYSNNACEVFTVGSQDTNSRIDIYLAQHVKGMSRNRVQGLIEEGRVTVNESLCEDKNYRLKQGDRVSINVPPPEQVSLEAENIELDIIYEDQDLLVINKPGGMVVHPAPGHSRGTMVNALLGHCRDLSGIGGVIRPGIVHRLDKDTTGLLIAVKNDLAYSEISRQLKERKLLREYIALVCGQVSPVSGQIEAPIGRHPRNRKKMAVVEGGREAVTRYRVIKLYNRHSLLKLNLETGRTHQIRVHLSYIGYPVVGDPLYAKGAKGGLPSELVPAQLLHARKIKFKHPRSGELFQFSVPLPEPFKKALIWLKNN